MPEDTEIIWSPTALGHLQAIYDYILPDNPAAALNVHEEIERTAGLLKDNPRLGHPGRVTDTRELVVPAYRNYILVYEIESRRVHILAVMHGRQQWPDSFGGEGDL
jgi:addiction module RelE/StbE family toxin